MGGAWVICVWLKNFWTQEHTRLNLGIITLHCLNDFRCQFTPSPSSVEKHHISAVDSNAMDTSTCSEVRCL